MAAIKGTSTVRMLSSGKLFGDSALHDDDETVKTASNNGHSYAGTIVQGVPRADSE